MEGEGEIYYGYDLSASRPITWEEYDDYFADIVFQVVDSVAVAVGTTQAEVGHYIYGVADANVLPFSTNSLVSLRDWRIGRAKLQLADEDESKVKQRLKMSSEIVTLASTVLQEALTATEGRWVDLVPEAEGDIGAARLIILKSMLSERVEDFENLDGPYLAGVSPLVELIPESNIDLRLAMGEVRRMIIAWNIATGDYAGQIAVPTAEESAMVREKRFDPDDPDLTMEPMPAAHLTVEIGMLTTQLSNFFGILVGVNGSEVRDYIEGRLVKDADASLASVLGSDEAADFLRRITSIKSEKFSSTIYYPTAWKTAQLSVSVAQQILEANSNWQQSEYFAGLNFPWSDARKYLAGNILIVFGIEIDETEGGPKDFWLYEELLQNASAELLSSLGRLRRIIMLQQLITGRASL